MVHATMKMMIKSKRNSTSIQITALACLLIVLIGFGAAPRAFALSGSVLYTFGASSSENESQYTLYYTIPPVIHVGVPTNMSFFVYVTMLSGWKIQSQDQILQLIINTAAKSVTIPQTENSVILYQGARWGPFNVTIDLNNSEFDLSPGQVTQASVFADLTAYEQYDDPAYPFLVDSGATMPLTNVTLTAAPDSSSASIGQPSGNATTTAGATATTGTISTLPPPPSSSSSNERFFVSIGVGAAVVIALTGLTFLTRKRNKDTGQPTTSAS
jgi:hypothetical protein